MLKDAGRFKDCEQLINGLPAKVRANPGVRGAIALLHMEQSNSEAAAKELTQLCYQDPQTPGHWLNLAANLRSLKHCNAALRVLKRGICRQPEVTDLQQALGQCLAELGRTEQALPVLQKSAGPLDSIKDEYLFNLQFLGAGYHLIPPSDLKNWARAWEQRKQQESGLVNLWADAAAGTDRRATAADRLSLSGLVKPSRVPVHVAGVGAARPHRSGGVGALQQPSHRRRHGSGAKML